MRVQLESRLRLQQSICLAVGLNRVRVVVSIDLLPTEDRDKPIRVLAETIKPISFHVGGDSDAVGEQTFRKMVRLIIRDAYRRNPQPLPVLVFLDGDHTGQPKAELNELVDDLLETSGIVFGTKDERSPSPGLMLFEQGEIMHYMARQTGGQFFAVTPSGLPGRWRRS